MIIIRINSIQRRRSIRVLNELKRLPVNLHSEALQEALLPVLPKIKGAAPVQETTNWSDEKAGVGAEHPLRPSINLRSFRSGPQLVSRRIVGSPQGLWLDRGTTDRFRQSMVIRGIRYFGRFATGRAPQTSWASRILAGERAGIISRSVSIYAEKLEQHLHRTIRRVGPTIRTR